MRRREFIAFSGAVAILPFAAGAQAQVRRVGALLASPLSRPILERVLKEKGWLLGQNLLIDYCISDGDTEESRKCARELISLKPDVLFAVTNTSMASLQAEGSNIPTVFAMVSDPIGMRYVETFARPGRNVTGFTAFVPSLGGKWVSLLKEIAPQIERIGVVYNPEPGNNSAAFLASIKAVAQTSGVVSVETPHGDSSSIERLIVSLQDARDTGLIFLPDALTAARRKEMTALVAKCRLPAIYFLRLFCDVGGLVSYGVNLNKIYAGAASYVDRILRGANPADLPVQAPTEFEFIINRKTARVLGLELPESLLARADEVIE